jgi:hypothetical protein
MTRATADREARLRRSLRRLGFDMVVADTRGWLFHIRKEGSKVNETPDLFGLDLAGVEQWIREQMQAP